MGYINVLTATYHMTEKLFFAEIFSLIGAKSLNLRNLQPSKKKCTLQYHIFIDEKMTSDSPSMC